MVILPAEDGGYGLIGSQQDYPELFTAIPWGSEQVLSVTRERLAALGLEAAYPDTMWDIDRPEDWFRWQQLHQASV